MNVDTSIRCEANSYDDRPTWARLYALYDALAPRHRGRSWLLRRLARIGVRRGRPFAWPMANGTCVAIDPREVSVPWSVGGTCFRKRRWEPHLERVLTQRLRPGDSAIDVGANIGYFSAAMARAVGAHGRIFAFEAVPETFGKLLATRSANGLTSGQLCAHAFAIGQSNDGTVSLRYNASVAGWASIGEGHNEGIGISVTVEQRSLDGLVAVGLIDRAPAVVKIDVEGHEMAVFRGATEMLCRDRPAVCFEFNRKAAASAGWTLTEVQTLLANLAGYRLFRIGESDLRPIIDPAELDVEQTYFDVLAIAG